MSNSYQRSMKRRAKYASQRGMRAAHERLEAELQEELKGKQNEDDKIKTTGRDVG